MLRLTGAQDVVDAILTQTTSICEPPEDLDLPLLGCEGAELVHELVLGEEVIRL